MTNYVTAASLKKLVHLSIGTLLFGITSLSQEKPKVDAVEPTLNELKGFTQKIYYSTGQETRAESIAIFIESAGRYFQTELQFTPLTKLYVLAPEHWKSFAAKPLHEVYGFPHNVDHERLVIAGEDNDFWRSYLPPVSELPPPIAVQITKAYSRPDGSLSMMPFFDLLALHEMGHSYTAQAGLKMHRYWMGELFVNIMLHTYVAEEQPELLPALEAFPNMVVGAGTANYKYTSLRDFEQLYTTMGMGPQNYGWYQCKLHTAAKDIYNAGGKDVLNKLWRALKEHQDTMSDEEFVIMLQNKVHPSVAAVYLDWEQSRIQL
ncbi:MAG: hypothetical protein EOO01_38600 [Chitinophagaceae bacterium]|nr:MAG: hypothetical protein EOO01_38600 [Chitinophagaceae bacterium]